jgi:hypothetical protein
MILRTLFKREMGLKSLAETGLSPFGIKVMKEVFILSRATFSS